MHNDCDSNAHTGKKESILNVITSTLVCCRWAVLIVVAGFGYFSVKSSNTAKKREFMIKQGQELQQQRNAVAHDDSSAASSAPVCEYHLSVLLWKILELTALLSALRLECSHVVS